MKLLLLLTLIGCSSYDVPGKFNTILENRAKEKCIPYGGFLYITKVYNPYDRTKIYYRAQCKKGRVYL